MKKTAALLLVTVALILGATTAHASEYYSEGNNGIIIDNAQISSPAVNGLLPLREIVEHTGGTVSWDGRTQQITIRRAARTVVITINETAATVNNTVVELAVPPQNIDGHTMVSLCFLADHMRLGAGYKNGQFILSTTPATRIAALVYHHILPDELNAYFTENPWTISTQNFEQQMRYLYENNFYTPTLDELEAFIHQGRPLPANSVMIHFDDGYYSNFVYAVPILREFGLRAVLFPITHNTEALGEYQPPLDYSALTHSAFITLRTQALDVFETASHTHDMHHRAPSGSATVFASSTKDEIVADLLQSFQFVGNSRAFAYPLGQHSNAAIVALEYVGVTMAFTVRSGYITPTSDPMRLNRFTVYRDTTMARFRNIVWGRV